MLTAITVAGQAINVVSVPSSPGFRNVQFDIADTVGASASPYTGQNMQTHEFLGAEHWTGVLALPPMSSAQAPAWKAFLMECRGIKLPFLLGDPAKRRPAGNAVGSAPQVDNSQPGGNPVMAQLLATKGWRPNQRGVLQPGDYLQIGYRLYCCLEWVNADANGEAEFAIWPSLREVPVDGAPLILNNPVGLFRLAENKRGWSASPQQLTALSVNVMEYR